MCACDVHVAVQVMSVLTPSWAVVLCSLQVKSVKKHKDTHFPIKNQFQEFQNKKNAKIGMAQ